MNNYAVELKPPVRKELEVLPDPVLARVVRKLGALPETPGPAGYKKPKGSKDHWSVRVGDWRSVYIIDDPAKLVSVTRIAHRREVYE